MDGHKYSFILTHINDDVQDQHFHGPKTAQVPSDALGVVEPDYIDKISILC